MNNRSFNTNSSKSVIKSVTMVLLICIVVISAFVSMPPLNAVHAQVQSYTLLAPLPCIPSPAVHDSSGNLISAAVTCSNSNGSGIQTESTVNVIQYLQYAYNLIIALASVAAVFMITYGGFLYMTSEAIPIKEDGLKKVRHAIYGLLLILCSWLILRTINPALVNIPPTFVPQLSLCDAATNPNCLNATNGQISGLLGDLSANQTNNAQLLSLQQQDKTTQTNIANLQSQYDELQGEYQTELGTNGNTIYAEELNAEAADVQNQINQQQANLTLGQNQTNLQQIMTNGLNSNFTFDQAKANIDQANQTALNQLDSLGPQQAALASTSVQQLNDQSNYAEGVLTVQKDCAQGAGVISSTVGATTGYVSGIFTSPSSYLNPIAAPTNGFVGAKNGYSQAQTAAAQKNINTDVLASTAFPISNPALKSQLSQYAQQAISSGCTSLSNVPPISAAQTPPQTTTTP